MVITENANENESGHRITDPTENKRLTRNSLSNSIHVHHTIYEMEQFLGNHILLQLNQSEMYKKGLKSVITFPQRKLLIALNIQKISVYCFCVCLPVFLSPLSVAVL